MSATPKPNSDMSISESKDGQIQKSNFKNWKGSTYRHITNPYEKIQKGLEYRDPLLDALHAMNDSYMPIKYCADKYQAPIRAHDSKIHKKVQKQMEPEKIYIEG